MAGDWLKIDHDLHEKPEVAQLSCLLGIGVDAVVGKLFRLWRWFDRHTVDGSAPGITPAFIESLLALEGSASALERVGWLLVRNDCICIPKFDRHNSKSAKQRALGRDRVKRSRNASRVTPPLPEKRREEKRRVNTPASASVLDSRLPAGPASHGKPDADSRLTGRPAGVFAALTTGVLSDTGKLLAWWLDASGRRKPVIGSSEADRLRVVCAAARAIEHGENPCALFADLVSKRRWEFITQDQEERARQRLKEFDRAQRTSESPVMSLWQETVAAKISRLPEEVAS